MNVLFLAAYTIVAITSNIPLIDSASGVPICSAIVPNGTALKGINPKVIIAILMVLPRISGLELSCIMVIFNDIYKELANPVRTRNGIAIQNTEICENIASDAPHITEDKIITLPRLLMVPIAANPMVQAVDPMPISINNIPNPSEFMDNASLAHAGRRA